MSFEFIFTKKAVSDMAHMDTVVKKRVAKKIQQLTVYDELTAIAKPLSGNLIGLHRIRIGQYRLICEILKDEVVVLRVQHRKDIYR